MDRLVTAQRRETNLERRKELWKQAEDRIYDQVWQILFPTGGFRRTFMHNYVINLRPHAVSAVLNCYGDAKIRSIWLDEGAAGGGHAERRIKTKLADGSIAVA